MHESQDTQFVLGNSMAHSQLHEYTNRFSKSWRQHNNPYPPPAGEHCNV